MSEKKKIRVLMLKPSLFRTGWAVADYIVATGEMVVRKTGCIRASKTAGRSNNSERVEQFGKRIVSIDILRQSIRQLVTTFKPDHIVTQDVDSAVENPTEFVSLSNCLVCVEITLFDDFKKSLMKLQGNPIKNHIQNSITHSLSCSTSEIIRSIDKIVLPKHCEDFIGDEANALAIGWYFIQMILPSLINPYT